jgi:opacity protein-like surface antigen
MKKLIAGLALFAAASIGAEELKFGDINYFLKQNQFNLSADLFSTYYKEKVSGTELETRGLVLQTHYSYGFTDRFNVTLGLDYAYDNETKNKTTPSDADYSQDGFANPSVGANFRLMNQNEGLFNIDFGAVARVNVEGAVEGSPDRDGNYADGRNSLELNARMGKKWNEANEWQIAVGGVYHADGESESKTAGGTQDIDEDSSLDLFIRASYQYRPVNEFMMLVFAQANQIGEAETENKDTGVNSEAETRTDLVFGFTAKYLIKRNFIARFNYLMSRNENYDIDAGAGTVEVKARRQNSFGLGVDFLF